MQVCQLSARRPRQSLQVLKLEQAPTHMHMVMQVVHHTGSMAC